MKCYFRQLFNNIELYTNPLDDGGVLLTIGKPDSGNEIRLCKRDMHRLRKVLELYEDIHNLNEMDKPREGTPYVEM